MALLFRDRVLETSTTTGTGTYTLAGAVTGYQAFSAVGNGNTCTDSALEVDGNGNPSGGWEVGLGTYTLSGTTLARTSIIASSNSNNAVNWAAGTRRITCVLPALQGNVAPQSLAGGRLTLATGHSVYAPQPATTSSIDTGTNIATFAAAHGWVTGTMVTSAATVDGLTAGTTYYINALSATTVAFYTTLANAEADSSKVDLTATTAVQIIPFGVQSTTIKYVPHVHDMIGLPSADGLTWGQYTIGASGLSLALGTLVSGSLYDVFCYVSGGVVTLKLGPAWSSTTSRGTGAGTTEIVQLNGRWVNAVSITSGPAANAGVLLGSIRAISTAATEDSQGYVDKTPKRLVFNADNQELLEFMFWLSVDSYSYNSTTARQVNGDAAAQFEVIDGLGRSRIIAQTIGTSSYISTAAYPSQFIGVDSTTVAHRLISMTNDQLTNPYRVITTSSLRASIGLGYHYFTWLERVTTGSTSATFYGDIADGSNWFVRSGYNGSVVM